LVDAMNRCFRAPLVETAAGGVAGGGATLSQAGAEVVARYRTLEAAVAKVTAKTFSEIKPLLRKTPLPSV
jgi:molybdate transport system regulatory protein